MRTFTTTLRRLFGGLGSLAAILTLLFGVPAFLWRVVGWPLPTTLPSWHQFSSSIAQTELPTATLAKTLACVGWIAWLVVAVALTVEIAAWFAGRSAPQVRFARPFQPLANKLVTTAAFLFAFSSISSGVGAAACISLQPRLAVATTSMSSVPTASTSAGATTASKLVRSDVDSPEASITVSAAIRQQTVRGRDTLWDLAERHLGDPHRWVEIWELNKGQLQNDGRSFESAHWIYPGWVLRMPADAVGVEEVQITAASVEVPSVDPTQSQPTEAPPPTIAASTTAAPSPSSTVAPPTSAPGPSTTRTISPTTERIAEPSANSDEPAVGAVSAGPTKSNADAPVTFPLRAPWVAGGLSAVGLLYLLDRLRRRQRSTRKPGDPIHLVPEGLTPVETGLRRSSARAEDRCDLLDASLRAFAAGAFGDSAMSAPQLLAARSFADSVELLFDRPLDGNVLGFTSQSGGRLWVTEPAITTDILRKLAADDSIAPYPTLVTMGEVDGGDLLVDLESVGIFTVHQGSVGNAADVFRRIVVELATSQWGDFFDVITIGDEVPDFAGFERTRRLSTLDDALDALEASAREIDESLNTIRATSTVAPRTSFALGDGWTPSVLVTTTELDTRQIVRLQAIVGQGGRGTAALLLDEVAIGQWGLRCGPETAVVSPVDIEVIPHPLPTAHADAVAELLDDAAVGHLSMSDLAVDAKEPLGPRDALGGGEPAAASDTPAEESHLVLPFDELAPSETDLRPMVRVLGAVNIDNMDHQGRRKVVELVVYLALHPDGVSADRLSEALWPDQPPKPDTLIRNVAYARTALGRDSNGDHHLPRMKAAEGRYRLGPEVRCDLLELTTLSKRARESTDVDEQIRLLTEALALVRDKPFDSVIDYEWAWAENFVAVAEGEVEDAASLLSERLTHVGRVSDADRARLVGLRGAPNGTRLTSTGIH